MRFSVCESFHDFQAIIPAKPKGKITKPVLIKSICGENDEEDPQVGQACADKPTSKKEEKRTLKNESLFFTLFPGVGFATGSRRRWSRGCSCSGRFGRVV